MDKIDLVIANAIRTWYADNNLPIPDYVDKLAQEVGKYRWDIYNLQDTDYISEDVANVASDLDITLTDEEARRVLVLYGKYESMEHAKRDTIETAIATVLAETRPSEEDGDE